VEFTFTAAFRRSGYGGTGPGGFAGIGDLITEFIGATGLDYGDGGSTGILNFRVTAIDPVADWLVGVAVNPANNSQLTIPHTYAAAATFTAFVSGCCRIGALQNSAGGSYRVETRVDFSGNTSPLSSLTPIVLVPDNLTYSFPSRPATSTRTPCCRTGWPRSPRALRRNRRPSPWTRRQAS
jgi:hypothetical protein